MSALTSPHDSIASSSKVNLTGNGSEEGLLGSPGPGSADGSGFDSPGGFYHNPHNPGFGQAVASPPQPRWANASPVTLNDQLNPRSASGGHDYASVSSGMRHRPNASKEFGKGSGFIVDTNPDGWDTIDGGRPEADDILHDPKRDVPSTKFGSPTRAIINIGALVLLAAGILTLFAGYPIIAYFTSNRESTKGGFNLGGANGTGQVGLLPTSMRSDLIDKDTPDDVKTRTGFDGKDYKLVFSDEFNTDGRSFYPGDDPFWEAVDLHYWGTNNYEWYDPAGVTTKDGALRITLSQAPEHNLNFRGGMLQSWNKFCFTGGYIEASVQLPGTNDVSGLWPAFWTMGNLGRAGYGASLEGTWPYSYESCDVGTLQNQTDANGNPKSSQEGGDTMFNRKHHTKALSFLTGQRLSACTCPEDYPELHPGPKLPDGSLRGRAAPEIDIFEAQVDAGKGKMTVSQSCQWAPYNQKYKPANTTGPAFTLFADSSKYNSYTGEVTQQSASVVTDASQEALQHGGDDSYAAYGFEYEPGTQGYVQWVSDGKPAWKLNPAFVEPDPVSEIDSRPFPTEPMYIIFNLGISQNFATPNWDKLAKYWPAVMSVDYVRVYQREDQYNVGCDPPDYPTQDFINRHLPAYMNANYTLWGATEEEGGYQQNWPRNRLNPNGCDAQLSKLPGSPTDPKPKAPWYPQSEIAQGEN